MRSTSRKNKLRAEVRYVTLFVLTLVALCPLVLFAQDSKYISLTGIPGVQPDTVNLVGLLNALYILAISFGALFAVVRIAIAGVQYSASGDNASARSKAKTDIYGALFGLAILLATYIVLYTINPNLTSLNILGNARPAVLTSPNEVTSAAPGTTSAVGAVNCGNQAKYTADDGKVYCGEAATIDTTSSVPAAQQLQTAADKCKAEGGTLTPSSIKVKKQVEQPDGRILESIVTEKQLVCVK